MAHTSTRSLLPREHGAYGQLALPVFTALGSGQPTLASILFAVAAGLALFAHEPLLVLLGQRGSRALREAGRRAFARLALLAAGTLFCAALALWLSGPDARLAFAAPVCGVLMIGLLIWQKQERTDLGEIVAAYALAAAGIPIAVAGGLSAQLALGTWGVFALGFGLITVALRRAIHGRKAAARAASWFLTVPAVLLCAGWLVARTSAAVGLAAIPMAGVALGLLGMPPSPKRLHHVGWLLMMSTVATGILLVHATRTFGT